MAPKSIIISIKNILTGFSNLKINEKAKMKIITVDLVIVYLQTSKEYPK